ncbi:hypothetical protein ACPB8Q_06635 [Methanocaldococcus indicus]|uniref:hypothetical protein n=1 Tax=Methanocaldococcus indicus TaxID=213231 RepID=UPI003C6D07B2
MSVDILKDYLDEDDYIELLSKTKSKEESIKRIINSGLSRSKKFELLLSIDKDEAIKYATKNRLYNDLIKYYYFANEYDKVVELFRKYKFRYIPNIIYDVNY